MKTYRSAPMDKLTFWVTISVFALLAFFIALALVMRQGFVLWIPVVLMALITGFSWQMRVRRYEVREDSIRIVRGWPLRTITIPLAEVCDVRRYDTSPAHGPTLRLMGVGGMFSSSGVFWNKETGEFFATVTNMGRAVFIQANEKYLISPDAPEGFIADVREVARLAK